MTCVWSARVEIFPWDILINPGFKFPSSRCGKIIPSKVMSVKWLKLIVLYITNGPTKLQKNFNACL